MSRLKLSITPSEHSRLDVEVAAFPSEGQSQAGVIHPRAGHVLENDAVLQVDRVIRPSGMEQRTGLQGRGMDAG